MNFLELKTKVSLRKKARKGVKKSPIFIYSRYDLRKKPLMVCVDCATKNGLLQSFEDSNLRCVAHGRDPGCMFCGEKTELAEVFIPDKSIKEV